MHNAVFTNGGLKSGEAIMFQGATSGVGMLGMQVAKFLGARIVIGTSRADEKLTALKAFGMDAGVNTSAADWPEKVREITGGGGVDLTIDMVSGAAMAGNLRAAAIRGRIVNVGRLGGQSAPFDFNLHAMKRISYIGVTFRSRSADEVAAIVAAAKADLWALIERREIGLPVVAAYPLDDIAGAFAAMRRDQHLGKIVITV
jgi:NADPH2:quinone reductase